MLGLRAVPFWFSYILDCGSPSLSEAVRVLFSWLAIAMLYGTGQALIYMNKVYSAMVLGLLFFLTILPAVVLGKI